MPVDLSVVIPVYNEERIVAETIRRLDAFLSLKSWEWEAVLSSDGSRDGTNRVVAAIAHGRTDGRIRLLQSETNRGKGAAVRRGVLAARGRMILVSDADLSTPIKEAEKLIGRLEQGWDIAIGSRALKQTGCDVQQSLKRRLASRVFNGLVRRILLKGFSDTQCGFKCFTRQAATALFQEQVLDGFSFDVEILYLAQRKGFKIAEVPVMWRQGQTSHVRLFRDSLTMLKDLFFLRKRYASEYNEIKINKGG